MLPQTMQRPGFMTALRTFRPQTHWRRRTTRKRKGDEQIHFSRQPARNKHHLYTAVISDADNNYTQCSVSEKNNQRLDTTSANVDRFSNSCTVRFARHNFLCICDRDLHLTSTALLLSPCEISYVVYRTARLPMPLNNLEGHFCCLKPSLLP